jgi:hypothetical protein
VNTFKIYDHNGTLSDEVNVNDTCSFVSGRVWKGAKGFYKGIGCPYQGHYLEPNTTLSSTQRMLLRSDVFYMGDYVSDSRFAGKIGVFQQKYQPQFEDFIGSCGVKELAIIEHSQEFQKSSVDILKSVYYDKYNSQYYFILNYKCNRVSFNQRGSNKKLYDLLQYMIAEDWNFIWDKNSIADVSYNGLVTDVADIFRSKELKHKIGTVYSILYSFAHADGKKFGNFIKLCGLSHNHQMDFVLNSLKLLNNFGVDIQEVIDYNETQIYINTVKNYLIEGKNCGDCSFIGLGDQIRETYRQTVLT